MVGREMLKKTNVFKHLPLQIDIKTEIGDREKEELE